MTEYSTTVEATRDVQQKIAGSDVITHPLASPALAVVVPDWTAALSGFEAKTTVTVQEALSLKQILGTFRRREEWLSRTARRLNIGTLNEHDPAQVLFIGLFRGLQERFANKQNLNPHKLAVLFADNYTVEH